MPTKPETEPATSSAAWGGQIESTMSLLAASSATEPASSSPDSAARRAVSALRPSEAQRTSWPRDRRTAPTAEPISPGCRRPTTVGSMRHRAHHARAAHSLGSRVVPPVRGLSRPADTRHGPAPRSAQPRLSALPSGRSDRADRRLPRSPPGPRAGDQAPCTGGQNLRGAVAHARRRVPRLGRDDSPQPRARARAGPRARRRRSGRLPPRPVWPHRADAPASVHGGNRQRGRLAGRSRGDRPHRLLVGGAQRKPRPRRVLALRLLARRRAAGGARSRVRGPRGAPCADVRSRELPGDGGKRPCEPGSSSARTHRRPRRRDRLARRPCPQPHARRAAVVARGAALGCAGASPARGVLDPDPPEAGARSRRGPGRALRRASRRARARVRMARARARPRVAAARPQRRARLRLRIPLPERVEEVVACSPFELVTRGLVSEGGDVELPSPTWPARGVVLAGGVAVLAAGVIEYEVVSGRELAVTLLRCVGTISRAGMATRPAPAGPDVPTPEAQMIGRTRLALAVLRGARPADLVPAWERFALPLRSVPATGGGRLPASGTLLDVRGAALSSVRRRGDAVEARIWNPSAAEAEASVDGATVRLGPAGIETVRVRHLQIT